MLEEQESPPRGVKEAASLEESADSLHGLEEETGVDNDSEHSPQQAGGAPRPKGTVHPIHTQLLKALLDSPLLKTVHAEVRNNSYWYKTRHELGPKKQAACLVKQDSSGRWESAIYKLKPRESDGERVPTRSFLSTHKSRWAAYRKCEAAQKERDANPYESVPDGDPQSVLATHFHLLVVSSAFDRLPPTQRHVLVFEALLEQMGEQLTPTQPTRVAAQREGREEREGRRGETSAAAHGSQHHLAKPDLSLPGPRLSAGGLSLCAPRRLKLGGSTYGPSTVQLDVFRVLFPLHPSAQGLKLFFECRTPSQWHPEQFIAPPSERYGSSHLGFQASTVPANMQGAAQKSRLRLLSHVQNAAEDRFGLNKSAPAAPPLAGGSILSLAETLGVDPIVSGAKHKRSGGVYGHFFSDLPKEVRRMIMDKFVENKKLIQREGNRKPEEKKKKKGAKKDSFQPKTGMSMLRAKLAAQLDQADYDAGTENEAQMMEEVYIAARAFERVAHRLQRIRRGAVLHRAARIIWWRRWAAINIQRVVRGRYSRMYTHLLARLRPRAVVPLQRRFRHRRSKRLLVRWQAVTTRLTRVVLPKIKRFLRNCFLNLTWKLTSNTVIIQSACRMFIAKMRVVRIREERRLFSSPLDFVLPWHRAAVVIQKRVRGNWDRRGYEERIELVLQRKVDWPRSIVIQRRWRGVLGRRRAAAARYKLECLLKIQRAARAYVRRVWDALLARAQLEERSATRVQKLVRGRIDRVLVRYLADAHFYTNKFLPAVVKVQAIMRACKARQVVGLLKRSIMGAIKMQSLYRRYLARLEYWRRYRAARERFVFNMAAKLQKTVRRFLAFKKLPALLLADRGMKLMAAKVILRAWVNFKYAKRMQLLLDDNRASYYSKKLPRFKQATDEVYQDQAEIQSDIKATEALIVRLKDRVRVLDRYLVEAQLRCSVIETEMQNLSPKDFDDGWGDVFAEEFTLLSRQLKMANEETRCLRAAILKHSRELQLLFCELEEVEIELDALAVMETEAFEGARRAAVGRIERRVLDARKRHARREKAKWRTDAVRTHVILRQRNEYQKMLKLNQDARDFSYARTISYEVRRQRKDFEELQRRAWLKQDTASRAKLQATYETYARPVQDTFDSVVAGSLSLLRNITLEQRAEIIKEQFRKRDKGKGKFKVGQFAALKNKDGDDKRALNV